MLSTPKRFAGFAGVTLVAALVAAPVAFGDDDEGGADAQVQELTVELKKLEVADTDHVTTEQLGKGQALRDKARTLVGNKKATQDLEWTLDELEAVVALSHAKIDKHEAQKVVEDKKATLAGKRGEFDTMTKTVADLEAKRTKLESQLAGGK
jgi:hypothetical protein